MKPIIIKSVPLELEEIILEYASDSKIKFEPVLEEIRTLHEKYNYKNYMYSYLTDSRTKYFNNIDSLVCRGCNMFVWKHNFSGTVFFHKNSSIHGVCALHGYFDKKYNKFLGLPNRRAKIIGGKLYQTWI